MKKVDTSDPAAARAQLLIWPCSLWPEQDRLIWQLAPKGKGSGGCDNPAMYWRPRTVEKNEDGYGRYLRWLHREGLFVEVEAITERITPERVSQYTAYLKSFLAPASVGATVGALVSAAHALAPGTDWGWLTRRSGRLKLKGKPSRDKRHAIQHTRALYRYGIEVMETADRGKGQTIPGAQRYQSGLIIALLAARPLRIRNFQAITIGQSLRWDGAQYWLTFGTEETKMRRPINMKVPGDLVPYLVAHLRIWRPVLLRQTRRFGGDPDHRRLWVDRIGKPLEEAALRSRIKHYTKQRFGTAVWPHLFRDCLLTSVAVDEPDLMSVSATLLGHASLQTGKHYNQARMLDASRRYGETISELRESFFDPQPEKLQGSK